MKKAFIIIVLTSISVLIFAGSNFINLQRLYFGMSQKEMKKIMDDEPVNTRLDKKTGYRYAYYNMKINTGIFSEVTRLYKFEFRNDSLYQYWDISDNTDVRKDDFPYNQELKNEDYYTRLEKAKRLLDGGLITEEEYERKKKEILEGI